MVVSGQITFFQGGTIAVNFGLPVNDLDVIADGLGSRGHADAGNQFCHTIGKTKSTTKAVIIYNTSGVKVVEANVVSGWGTNILLFNVTLFSTSFPWSAIVRS